MDVKRFVRFALGLALVLVAVAVPAHAGVGIDPVPEVGAGELGSAVTLLAGGYLVLSSRLRSRK